MDKGIKRYKLSPFLVDSPFAMDGINCKYRNFINEALSGILY